MSQQFLKPRLRELAGYGIAAAGVIIFITWFLEREVASIQIDWTFVAPTVGLIATAVPTLAKLFSWINNRLEINDKRLRELEISVNANSVVNRDNSSQITEIQKSMLRQEAKVEAFSNYSKIAEALNELVATNKAILQKVSRPPPP